MLWHKAWRETRVRWGISATVLCWACLVIILFHSQFRSGSEGASDFTAYLWNVVYKGSIRDMFVILTLGLALGGLLQERKQGAAAFTLALPVSRSRVVRVRAAVGFLETVALALIPAFLLP